MATAEDLFYQIHPPTEAATDPKHQVLTDVTGAAADNWAWVAAMTTAGYTIPGQVLVVLEATTTDVWVRFKPVATAAATTAVNGLIIKAGQPGRPFMVDPIGHAILDHISTGVGSLQIQVSSGVGYRRTI